MTLLEELEVPKQKGRILYAIDLEECRVSDFDICHSNQPPSSLLGQAALISYKPANLLFPSSYTSTTLTIISLPGDIGHSTDNQLGNINTNISTKLPRIMGDKYICAQTEFASQIISLSWSHLPPYSYIALGDAFGKIYIVKICSHGEFYSQKFSVQQVIDTSKYPGGITLLQYILVPQLLTDQLEYLCVGTKGGYILIWDIADTNEPTFVHYTGNVISLYIYIYIEKI